MKPIFRTLTILILIALFVVVSNCFYTIYETQQVIITQFGKPIGTPIKDAGLHFKMPFLHKVNRINRQILEWDGQRTEMPTRDKLYISVDTFARWKITKPLEYYRRLRDERSAQSRLDDILGSETRNAIAKHNLIEVIRTTKERTPVKDDTLKEISEISGKIGVLQPIRKGRKKIEQEIQREAAKKLAEFGILLLDVRFKRINYNQSVVRKIYERMISERQQIAARFRSEGEGEAAKINGNRQAYQQVEEIKGQADAKATEIYAVSYGKSNAARTLYSFLKSMETYKKVMNDTTVVFSGEGELFEYLNPK